MNLEEFKNYCILDRFGLQNLGRTCCFLDFGNINYWFEKDKYGSDEKSLPPDCKLRINLEGLNNFLKFFSSDIRFYYGYDQRKDSSLKFISKAKSIFGRRRVFTKEMQLIKHYLDPRDLQNTRQVNLDRNGNFIFIPKCNFDVEISVDAIRLMDQFDSFCLLSSDADFVSLIKFLRKNQKKIILIKGGYINHSLKNNVDILINAQDIKSFITEIKQKSSLVG